MKIESVQAQEILDSRGRPTVLATVKIGGFEASASVPSGASTGEAEAMELRDREAARYGGLGVRQACANVNGAIASAVVGREWTTQRELDRVMLDLDGTANKSNLGANALLGVSLACARAVSGARGLALWKYFAEVAGTKPESLPRPTVNLFSGGKHAGGQIAVQDILLVPMQPTIDDGLAAVYAVYQAAAALCGEVFGARALVADEGGLAPDFTSADQALRLAVRAIERAGFRPGDEVALAVDVAASHFYQDGVYTLEDGPRPAAGMIEKLKRWCADYPIVSLEDGLSENDWAHWPALREALGAVGRDAGGSRTLVLGDDLLCTNPRRIERAIRERAADALLLKVNQIGTVTEAAAARKIAIDAGWHVTVSARSGETEDDWLTDLALGFGGHHLKVGSITRSERLAKWNRLLVLERQTGLPVSSGAIAGAA